MFFKLRLSKTFQIVVNQNRHITATLIQCSVLLIQRSKKGHRLRSPYYSQSTLSWPPPPHPPFLHPSLTPCRGWPWRVCASQPDSRTPSRHLISENRGLFISMISDTTATDGSSNPTSYLPEAKSRAYRNAKQVFITNHSLNILIFINNAVWRGPLFARPFRGSLLLHVVHGESSHGSTQLILCARRGGRTRRKCRQVDDGGRVRMA